MALTYRYIDGWHELLHNTPDAGPLTGIPWAPCEEWCKYTFEPGEWFMRNPIYHKSSTINGVTEIIDTTPLTWMFKREQDAVLFKLKWA